VYFEYICWKFAGRLLDRVNTPLVTVRRYLNIRKMFQQPFKLFKAIVSLSQISWKVVPQLMPAAVKHHYVSIAAAGPSDDTCP